MAQFFRDFSEDTLGGEIPGFVREPPSSGANSNTDAVLVKRENAGAINGVGANLESAQTNRTSFRWTEVSPQTEGEIAGRILRTNTFDTEVLLGNINVNYRGEGIMFISRGSNFWITRFRASNATVVNRGQIAAAPLSINSSTWFYYRAQLIGGFARLKVWTGTAEDEPVNWLLDVEVNDSDGYLEPLDGRVCIGNFRVNRSCFWDFVSFGTDGDPAPLEPLGPGAEDEAAADIGVTSTLTGSARVARVAAAPLTATSALVANTDVAPPVAELLFFDDFNRADEGFLASPWLGPPDGPFAIMPLISNEAAAVSSFAWSAARLDVSALGFPDFANMLVRGAATKQAGLAFLNEDNSGLFIDVISSDTGVSVDCIYIPASPVSFESVGPTQNLPAFPAGDFIVFIGVDNPYDIQAIAAVFFDTSDNILGSALFEIGVEYRFSAPIRYVMPTARRTTTRLDNFALLGFPVDPTPLVPPVNLGVTNLQATSARLTWEEG